MYVIHCINPGAAGGVCAETLRQNGYKGYITMATNEKHLPYDRPKLSKVYIERISYLHILVTRGNEVINEWS